MSGPPNAAAERLAREIEHHRQIADRAEIVWNWDSPSGRRRADRRGELFVRHARLGPGTRALELGCGTGEFLRRVAHSGAEIRGIDLSQHLLTRARVQAAAFSCVSLVCGNAEQLPCPDASVDAVYGSSVLHHLDLPRALGEVFRVLRPGGRLVCTEPNLANPQVAFMFHVGLTKRYFGVSPDEKAFTRFRAQAALWEAGFRRCRVRPFDFLHPATGEAWVNRVAWLGARLERIPLLRELSGSLVILAEK